MGDGVFVSGREAQLLAGALRDDARRLLDEAEQVGEHDPSRARKLAGRAHEIERRAAELAAQLVA